MIAARALFCICMSGTSAIASEAGPILDMRQCPLNRITFVDPWAKGEFEVARVGKNYSYLCQSGMTTHPPADEQCMGPYGDLVFEGSLRKYEDSQPETVLAIWSVIKGAPCCGWSVERASLGEAMTQDEGFQWLDEQNMPKLGEFGFAGISFEAPYTEGTSIFGNPKYAMKCR